MGISACEKQQRRYSGVEEVTMNRESKTMRLMIAMVLAGPAVMSAQTDGGTTSSGEVSRPITAIGYRVDSGATRVDLKPTDLIPGAMGTAKVEARKGITNVEVDVKGLAPGGKLGTEFLTYVLWAVTPDGRAINIGEVLPNNSGSAKLRGTTQSQTFSLFVTAEPYFSVRQPSELVVLENQLRKDTKGKVFPINDYKLMRRVQYQKLGNPLALTLDLKKVPIEVYEARNAVEIARSRGAEKYAPEIFVKAETSLKMTENALATNAKKQDTVSTARQAVQFSEDARALAVLRQQEEKIELERRAAAEKARVAAEAKAAAEAAEMKRRADEEAKRQAELAAAREAQLKAESDAAAAKAQAEAEIAAARAKAEADLLKAKEAAALEEAERSRQAAESLRTELLTQFNHILETRDTPRGLVVNMADVLFDTGKYALREIAREKLARFAGIVLAHSGLNLEVEGHTDSTGSDELNQTLSEQRAGTVRNYLVGQGLVPERVTAKGLGKSMPVADNSTLDGRQRNRRVEIIVSGEVIGTKIGI
jgi:outer membrane protein OmpA-like peptidoglycan-associated protein